jgi:AcrR family transcriptional regulator
MNTVSTQTRKYELKARAESQRETRDRIAAAAAELHGEKGVAQTTVAEIARRAGVTRLTVYNHFPELSALLPACAAHYSLAHPLPEFGEALDTKDAEERARAVLALLYVWYRETEPMFGKLFSDRASVPELDRFLSGDIDRVQDQLADGITSGFAARGRRKQELRALARVAVDFWTWRRLAREGLADDASARTMAATLTSTRG